MGAVDNTVPATITGAGPHATRRFIEFFTANIRNRNTRAAYAHAVTRFFDWAEVRGLTLERIEPVHVAAYIEQRPAAAPTVKQHLAAIRMLFDYLVTGHIMFMNPASSVRGPKYVTKRGHRGAVHSGIAAGSFAFRGRLGHTWSHIPFAADHATISARRYLFSADADAEGDLPFPATTSPTSTPDPTGTSRSDAFPRIAVIGVLNRTTPAEPATSIPAVRHH